MVIYDKISQNTSDLANSKVIARHSFKDLNNEDIFALKNIDSYQS